MTQVVLNSECGGLVVFVVLFQLSFMHVDMDRWSRGHLLACGWPDFRHTHTYSWRNFPVVLSHNTTFTFAATFSPDGATVQHTCHNMYIHVHVHVQCCTCLTTWLTTHTHFVALYLQ